MLILWFCAILQLAYSFSVMRNINIFLDEKHKEDIIELPGNPVEPHFSYYKWEITAELKHTIELDCDDIFLTKTYNCTKGSLTISDHETIEEFCELKHTLKRKSIKNKMEIKFWKFRFTIGNFRCQVRLVSPIPDLEITAEESDYSEYDTNIGTVAPALTTCPCGWSNKFRGKIVGGQETKINQYPLMAVLVHRVTNTRICGGTIITSRHVLTAAHCKWSPLSVIVGEHDFDQSSETNATVKIDVEYFFQHNAFSINYLEYDIAIVELSQEISFNRDVGPVCLPSKKPDIENEYVIALGWGVIHPDKRVYSDVLREVSLKVINTEKCSKSYKEFGPISRSQFCTHARKKDTCQGDSGGPLLWLDPELNRYIQVGIVSYGKRCATYVPAVNTNVYYFMDWIRSVVRVTSKEREKKYHVCVKKNAD